VESGQRHAHHTSQAHPGLIHLDTCSPNNPKRAYKGSARAQPNQPDPEEPAHEIKVS